MGYFWNFNYQKMYL